MRVAILGGSFDPVHKGHLQIAKTALKKLAVDEIWFMPTFSSPLKDAQSASFHDRCAMVKRAIHPFRRMRLCTLEGEWGDASYTIRSVKELIRRYPNHTFCWLIGDDQAQHFDKWKDCEKLKKLINFYVFQRRGENIPLPEGLQRVPMELIDISSTTLRSGHALYMLPDSVLDYIGKHGLYLHEMIRDRMSEDRYLHSLSVALLCERLARAHQLDVKRAYQMGLVHDVCKQMPKQKACIWMSYHQPSLLHQAIPIWHGYIGADYIRHHFHMYDKQLCEAIFHHVLGRNKTDYDRILYIADKLDPSRGYDSNHEILVSERNLKQGFALVKQQQLAYLQKQVTI